jgi:hypothetical protein
MTTTRRERQLTGARFCRLNDSNWPISDRKSRDHQQLTLPDPKETVANDWFRRGHSARLLTPP